MTHSGILVAYLFGFPKSSTTLLVFGGGLTVFFSGPRCKIPLKKS